ncbi:MAG: winged helix-turn-helix domain-containing tetratricopeptide repeat protein [Paracoccaceae bacterium]
MEPAAGPIDLNGTRLDPGAGTLTRNGAPVPLRAKSFALLCHLARHAGKVLSKSDILDAVWPVVTVSEDSLTQAIHDIRVAVGDEAGEVLCTVRGRGYMLKPTPAAALSSAPITPERSIRIAVLPFDDRAAAEPTRPLVSALADDIAGGLARFRTLTVIARGSAEAAAAETSDPVAIARQLSADYLIQGTVREAPGTLTLRLTLIDGAAGALIWSRSFDCSGEQLLGVETAVTDELVAHLSTGIETAFEAQAARLPRSSLSAYTHFARGRGAMRATTAEGIREARDHLLAAVAVDPDFAEAWAMLAWAEMASHDYRMAPPEVLERALGNSRRAVALAPNESVTVSTLGYIQTMTCDYDAAEANIALGLRLNPSNVDALMDAATLMLTRGRPMEALACLDRTEAVNPLRYHHHVRVHRAEALYMLGRYAEAATELARAVPLPARRHLWAAASLAQAGRAAEAAPHLAAFAAEFPGRDPVEVARHSYNYERPEDSDHLAEGLRMAVAAAGGGGTVSA